MTRGNEARLPMNWQEGRADNLQLVLLWKDPINVSSMVNVNKINGFCFDHQSNTITANLNPVKLPVSFKLLKLIDLTKAFC